MTMRVEAVATVNQPDSEGSCHPGISPGVVYAVVGIDQDNYRVINDRKEPVLYQKFLFRVVDDGIPQHWVRRDYEDGEYYIDPPEFSALNFYEKYFDREPGAVTTFNRYLALNGFGVST